MTLGEFKKLTEGLSDETPILICLSSGLFDRNIEARDRAKPLDHPEWEFCDDETGQEVIVVS